MKAAAIVVALLITVNTMDERTLQIRVGVVVLAAVAITGILVILFGEGQSVIRIWQGDDIVVAKAAVAAVVIRVIAGEQLVEVLPRF